MPQKYKIIFGSISKCKFFQYCYCNLSLFAPYFVLGLYIIYIFYNVLSLLIFVADKIEKKKGVMGVTPRGRGVFGKIKHKKQIKEGSKELIPKIEQRRKRAITVQGSIENILIVNQKLFNILVHQ